MIRIVLLVMAGLGAAGAQAQVFKCLDSSGRVVYSQNPCPPSMKPESMSRGGIPPASAVAPAAAADPASKTDPAKSRPKTEAEKEQAFRQRQQDQAKASKEADAKNAQAQLKKANCTNARQRLAQLEIGGRISRVNEQGERYYMDDATIESEKARARNDVSQMCN